MIDKMLKVLNCYAGIGGNRKLWEDVEVTAIEIEPEIAEEYHSYFPEDKIIVGDAHDYLLRHFKEFDFIWSSPPCQSHSHLKRLIIQSNRYRHKYFEYFDMKLWQEIILLKHFAPPKTMWVIENVKPYYKPLIAPNAEINRHLFWSNFYIRTLKFKTKGRIIADMTSASTHFGYNISMTEIDNKRQVLRNLVNPQIGKMILDFAKPEIENKKYELFGEINKNVV